VTGWQSGGGDQGGWNPNQSFGPEAQTSKYGTDPYANQDPYGADPYAVGGYDPYQQYPPTGGFPAQGYGPPPPPEPKRSKVPMILSLVAIVIIIGAVVTIVLVNRHSDQPIAEQDPTSTTSTPEKTTESSSSESPSTTKSSGGGDRDDWLTIDNTEDSTLTYQVPPDWKQSSDVIKTDSGVDFTGVAEYGTYECEGKPFFRTYAASADVQSSGGEDLDLAKTMDDFTNSLARSAYGEDVRVEAPSPTETKVGDKKAMTLTAKLTPTADGPCEATEAEVAMVGVEVQEEGKPTGVALLVVVSDTAGGPADPKPLDPAISQEILSTVSAS
jgi:hypothetical protein